LEGNPKGVCFIFLLIFAFMFWLFFFIFLCILHYIRDNVSFKCGGGDSNCVLIMF
jgi:hypothetical protein